jgi:putative Mg2+ transporter-C (MgtC) family protein
MSAHPIPSRYVIAAMLSEAFGSNPFNILPHVLALLVAYVLAIPIGWNREQEERSAGLRTFPLVAVATCGFIQASETMFADHPEGLARVMEGLITGMGFIGGGAILRQQDSVKGTATAASLWVTGAIGAAVGLGSYDVAVVLTLVTIATLWIMAPLKRLSNLDEKAQKAADTKRKRASDG